jgi:hypothetical protein
MTSTKRLRGILAGRGSAVGENSCGAAVGGPRRAQCVAGRECCGRSGVGWARREGGAEVGRAIACCLGGLRGAAIERAKGIVFLNKAPRLSAGRAQSSPPAMAGRRSRSFQNQTSTASTSSCPGGCCCGAAAARRLQHRCCCAVAWGAARTSRRQGERTRRVADARPLRRLLAAGGCGWRPRQASKSRACGAVGWGPLSTLGRAPGRVKLSLLPEVCVLRRAAQLPLPLPSSSPVAGSTNCVSLMPCGGGGGSRGRAQLRRPRAADPAGAAASDCPARRRAPG